MYKMNRPPSLCTPVQQGAAAPRSEPFVCQCLQAERDVQGLEYVSIAPCKRPRMQSLRAFLSERLTAAAEEIFGAVENTIAEYKEEISRAKDLEISRLRTQLRLLKSGWFEWKPRVTKPRVAAHSFRFTRVLSFLP